MSYEKFLEEFLEWEPDLNTDVFYICKQYPKNICYLRMNNFPEEPLWTLIVCKQIMYDFDDLPKNWKIKYREW